MDKKRIKTLLRESIDNSTQAIGYKVMRISQGQLVSGANKVLNYKARVGEVIQMPGNGIYLSTVKDYVLDYYSGLADDEVLLTLSFDKRDITTGDITDKEPELSVKKVVIRNIEVIN